MHHERVMLHLLSDKLLPRRIVINSEKHASHYAALGNGNGYAVVPPFHVDALVSVTQERKTLTPGYTTTHMRLLENIMLGLIFCLLVSTLTPCTCRDTVLERV